MFTFPTFSYVLIFFVLFRKIFKKVKKKLSPLLARVPLGPADQKE